MVADGDEVKIGQTLGGCLTGAMELRVLAELGAENVTLEIVTTDLRLIVRVDMNPREVELLASRLMESAGAVKEYKEKTLGKRKAEKDSDRA